MRGVGWRGVSGRARVDVCGTAPLQSPLHASYRPTLSATFVPSHGPPPTYRPPVVWMKAAVLLGGETERTGEDVRAVVVEVSLTFSASCSRTFCNACRPLSAMVGASRFFLAFPSASLPTSSATALLLSCCLSFHSVSDCSIRCFFLATLRRVSSSSSFSSSFVRTCFT